MVRAQCRCEEVEWPRRQLVRGEHGSRVGQFENREWNKAEKLKKTTHEIVPFIKNLQKKLYLLLQNLMKNFNNSNRSDATADLITRRIASLVEQSCYRGADFGAQLSAALQTIVKVHDEIEECRRTCASGKHLYAIHEQLALM